MRDSVFSTTRDIVFMASVFSVSSMSLQYRRCVLCIIAYILTASVLTSAGQSHAFVPCQPEGEGPNFSCKEEYGIVVFKEIHATDASTARFDTNHTDVEVKAWLDEHQHIGVNCSLTIGEVEVHHTPVVVYTTTQHPITMRNTNEYSSPILCTANVSYAAVYPSYNQSNVTTAEGDIQFPVGSDQTDDPMELGYASQLRLGWTLIGPPGSIWELTITSLDLGSRQTNLNLSSTQYHQSQGDFLLVGPGSELLVHDEVMFYGSNAERTIVTIHNHSCHVVFYGSYHERMAKGFSLHYRTLDVKNPTTRIPVTPTMAPPSDPEANIWVPINGIDLLNVDDWPALLARFKSSIAGMANEYLDEYLDSSQPHQTVSSTDVKAYVKTQCIRQGCADTCTSFLIGISSIYVKDGKKYWLFNEDKLNDMVRREDLQIWFENITPESTYCSTFHQNWYGVVGLSVGLVVLVVALSTITWWYVGRRSTAKNTTKTALQNKREEHERVRRSSSMLSKIGGGKVERKTSHPFQDLPMAAYGTSNATYASADSALPEMFDYDEYKDFEVIFEDNFDRFVGEEVLADFSKSRTYTNTAFVDDEGDNTAE